MKKIIGFTWAHALVAVALCFTLFSFAGKIGAHSFQVFLDDKMVIDQYVNMKSPPPTLKLDPAGKHSQLIVKYNECGRTVSGRTITIKDEHDQVLKDWHFEGAATGFKDPMTVSIKDISALKQKGSNTLNLYYSSKEFPEGQQVAKLVIGAESTTAFK